MNRIFRGYSMIGTTFLSCEVSDVISFEGVLYLVKDVQWAGAYAYDFFVELCEDQTLTGFRGLR
jgi:hypothetical protein